MNDETSGLSRKSAAFALAAVVTIIVNTVLACAKDANHPLKKFMASLAGHDWTTQGIADVLLFLVLGFIFLALGLPRGNRSGGFVSLFVVLVAAAGAGLAAWYVLY